MVKNKTEIWTLGKPKRWVFFPLGSHNLTEQINKPLKRNGNYCNGVFNRDIWYKKETDGTKEVDMGLSH